MLLDEPQPQASLDVRAGVVLASKYELLAPLATGGMGEVWTARNLTTGAHVAAKVLLPTHAAMPEGHERFRREAQATAALAHRSIVRVFDLVELDSPPGSLVLVMELLRGATLANHIREKGRLSLGETLDVAFPLLSALTHAHARGIVHRDLKPENVILAVEPDGEQIPKIVDFGISKQLRGHPITLDGQIMGTLSYMSPEQTCGRAVDPRSDVFSLGVLLYECLAGTNPFAHSLEHAVAARNLQLLFAVEPAPLEGVPRAVSDVVLRAMDYVPERRFASISEMADALRVAAPPLRARAESPTSLGPLALAAATTHERPAWQRRGAVVVVLLAMVASSALTLALRPSVPLAAPAAAHEAMAHDKRFVADDDRRGADDSTMAETPIAEVAILAAPHPAMVTAPKPPGAWKANPYAGAAATDASAAKPARTSSGLARDPGF